MELGFREKNVHIDELESLKGKNLYVHMDKKAYTTKP